MNNLLTAAASYNRASCPLKPLLRRTSRKSGILSSDLQRRRGNNVTTTSGGVIAATAGAVNASNSSFPSSTSSTVLLALADRFAADRATGKAGSNFERHTLPVISSEVHSN